MFKKSICLYLALSIFICPYVFADTSFMLDPYSGNGMLELTTGSKLLWNTFDLNINNTKTVNNKYELSFWAKGTGVSTAFRITDDLNPNNIPTQAVITPSSEWTQFVQEFTWTTLPNGNAVLRFTESSRDVSGRIYIDNITIKRNGIIVESFEFEESIEPTTYGKVTEIENTVAVYNSNGDRIRRLEQGELTVSMEYVNKEGKFPSSNFIAAVYQGGMLESVGITDVTILSVDGKKTIDANVYVSRVDTNTKLKVMLWSQSDGLRPIVRGITVADSKGILHDIAFIDDSPTKNDSFPDYIQGVNFAYLEFANIRRPYYETPRGHEASYAYFTDRGVKVFRVPVLWEMLQPYLNGPLEPNYLGYLLEELSWAEKYDAKIIVDIHNYGGRSLKNSDIPGYSGDEPDIFPNGAGRKIGQVQSDGKIHLTKEHFADLWIKLSDVFNGRKGIYAYDLMNEPSGGLSQANWKEASQYCVEAIRANDDNTLILVEGMSYSNAQNWVGKNGVSNNSGWIDDPVGNFMYSPHIYFDDQSGTKADWTIAQYAGGYSGATPAERVINKIDSWLHHPEQGFIPWAQKHGHRGFFGEFGIPVLFKQANGTMVTNPDLDQWLIVLDEFYAMLRRANMGGTYWAAGINWGNYYMLIQPDMTLDTTSTGNRGKTNWQVWIDAPQMSILRKYVD